MRKLRVAVLAAALLGAACSGQPAEEDSIGTADAPPIAESNPEVPAQPAPPGPPPERALLRQRGSGSPPSGSVKPAVPGVNEGRFYTPPAGDQEPAEDPDHPKNKGTTVVSSEREGLSWRLNVYREDGKTCLAFVYRATAQGGGSATCDQKPPLDSSGKQNAYGRVLWGLTSSRVAHVRVEHADGATETFATVAHDGYSERFYAGEIARTPITRLVGLDAAGRAVAEKNDMGHYNR